MKKSIARKIKALRTDLMMTQPEFAAAINADEDGDPVDQGTISKWENGRHEPTMKHMAKLAKLANVSLKEFAELAPPGINERASISITGEIQAGSWREEATFPEDDWREVSLPIISEWSSFNVQARIVVGNSMNRIYPDGSLVYIVPIAELGRMPNNGEHVVVQRVSVDGTYEVTLKEYVLEDDGKVYLWPRSSDPEHQAPLQYRKSRRGVDRVEIVGIVVMATLMMASTKGKPKLALVKR